MFERNISVKRVLNTIELGETIEDYSAELPEPSRLVLGIHGKRPFHVVTSANPGRNEITIITAYIPDPGQWDKYFKRRRS